MYRNLYLTTLLFNVIILSLLIVPGFNPIQAQNEPPCGVVDAMMYPVENMVDGTIARGYDDFATYRGRWNGNHTGLDVAFRRQGDPIHAAARGRVTYSDIEGWDTERGVVIIEHTFPDRSVYYSLYGHVEETDEILLPDVGDCVEMGDVIAAVGWPSSSAPHLHYEIRDFLPDDGGPGYVTGNPIEDGWFHPLDFTALWQARLSGAFVDYTTFDLVPTLPPVLLDTGLTAMVNGPMVTVVAPPSSVLWRGRMNDIVNGLAALPGGRVVARSRSGQTAVLANGRYEALWQVDGMDEPFFALGETLIFITVNGGLIAYDPTGTELWRVGAPPGSDGFITHFLAETNSVSIGVELNDGFSWRIVSRDGDLLHEATYQSAPLVTFAPDGSWIALADRSLHRIHDGQNSSDANFALSPGRSASLAVDLVGNLFLYTGDSQNTVVSYAPDGSLRWRARLPAISGQLLPSLLAVDAGCLLYGLDTDGQLSVFDAATGDLIHVQGLYAGGSTSGRPGARLLHVDLNGRVHVNPGFLTSVTLDGSRLGGDVAAGCLLG